MPKGRLFVPPRETEGIWFQHRGLPPAGPMVRELSTCTGLMLSAPFRQTSAVYPPLPPVAYKQRDARNFKQSNDFSVHANQHSLQDHGVYFGDGHKTRHLGKRIVSSEDRQHFTERNYLKHHGRTTVDHDLHTVYGTDYEGRPPADQPDHRRRFPRIHEEGSPGGAELTTTTTSWYRPADLPTSTPLHVLAVSQEPLLPANRWQYSYHSLSKCYPQYDHLGGNRQRSSYGVWRLNAPHVQQANSRIVKTR